MTRLYLTPLPKRTTDTASGQTGSQVQQAGLLDTGGTSVENIATENVDFRKQGRIQLGPTLSRKVADELDSLSESAYTSLPLFDPSESSLGRKAGYYEVARADVTPAQEAREDVYTYDVNLTLAGTREDSRRAIRTNPEGITTSLATGSPGPIGIPAEAINPRWYNETTGTEEATATTTVTAEYGDVELYDYTAATADAPDLVYDLPFEREGPVDVRVYDDRDTAKFTATASGGQVSVWPHAFHTGWQFDGTPIVDTGRLRLSLDGGAGAVSAETWDSGTETWSDVGLTMGDYALAGRSFERIGPESVTITVRLRDTTDGSVTEATLRARRGRDVVVARPIIGTTLPAGVTEVFGAVLSDQTTDPNPRQGLRNRSDLS